MPPEQKANLTLEFAHVLFMDIVGYSKLLIDEQTRRLHELQDIIRHTDEFRRAHPQEQLIRLPTGDGMALVFFGDALAPVRCALEVSNSLKSSPEIELRMGVHSGPVSRVTDINERVNVTGEGINTAQRVMDVGDEGHILVSRVVADVMRQVSGWDEHLTDLGEFEVKHGLRLHIFNLYTGGCGNPDSPKRKSQRTTGLPPSTQPSPAPPPQRPPKYEGASAPGAQPHLPPALPLVRYSGATTSVNIPPRLSALLQKDDNLTAAVQHAISVVRPWFEDNKLVFFPEYPDHGPKHIQEVFETAESLITESAWEILNPKDVAVLLLGIILHDCAMHLSEDGFISLIGDDSRPLDEGFSDQPWPRLWHDFMAEARRFDDRKLKALFDDVEPVRAPPLDPLMMTKRDRLLIGEFLRRHHPRLAHEIALTGVPGPPDRGLPLGDIPPDVRDLAGLVARSHGLDLRVSVDYLNHKNRWGARRTAGVHATYLMVLVRIADYLQIQSARATREVLRVRSLRSPVSRGEWDAHEAITDIHPETDDPEALWVEAAPKDISTYLKLKYLLSDIQREVDESWAVLGEVYGPKEDLRGFGIGLRRIRSNIQDVAAFARSVDYVPRHAALQTAGVDLLKLLITPLYGDRPEVGVRELLQNAVDARLELEDYLGKNPQMPQPDLQEQSADVVIAITQKEDGTKWLSVSDRGVGMTVDTVLNYFLKAGASFRFSHAWRRQHEDEQGQTRVLRSGRFGIGVLAGFLLGDEIQVSTRHVTARPNEGISFVCRLEDDTIQLNRTTRPVGTTVSIQLPEAVYRKLLKGYSNYPWHILNELPLSWVWYCLREPSVHLSVLGHAAEQGYVLPSAGSDLPPEWRRVRHPDFRDIHWTYLGSALTLTCNGIAVIDLSKEDDDDDGDEDEVFGSEGFTRPKLSVFDPRGALPLNLQRTGLSVKELPFEAELLKDICYDILAFLLVHTPGKRPSVGGQTAGRNALKAERLRHPGAGTDRWVLFAREGLALLELWDIQRPVVQEIYALTGGRLLGVAGAKSFQPHIPFFGEKELKDILGGASGIGGAWIKGARVILHQSKLQSLIQSRSRGPKNDYLERRVKELWEREWENDTWLLMKRGDCPPQELNLDKLPPKEDADPSEFLTTIYPGERARKNSLLAETWRETMDLPHIPYDVQKRRELLAGAYHRLASYIKAWEEIRLRRE